MRSFHQFFVLEELVERIICCVCKKWYKWQGNCLKAYDMEKSGVWIGLNVSLPSGDLSSISLLSCQGKLFLVGKTEDDYLAETNMENLRKLHGDKRVAGLLTMSSSVSELYM
ncbi:hypothetical protein Sjap_018334 [Stephania japonica]|uniref:Uncharacterized protein n=1 Tax=Stephania japonica TaxID=461633 RepID=A0AAP0NL08_9MAGN